MGSILGSPKASRPKIELAANVVEGKPPFSRPQQFALARGHLGKAIIGTLVDFPESGLERLDYAMGAASHLRPHYKTQRRLYTALQRAAQSAMGRLAQPYVFRQCVAIAQQLLDHERR